MTLQRREFLQLAIGAAALPAASRMACAQTYPSRPITMIVSGAAGSASDVVARILAERTAGVEIANPNGPPSLSRYRLRQGHLGVEVENK
jgi:hypothetical protein